MNPAVNAAVNSLRHAWVVIVLLSCPAIALAADICTITDKAKYQQQATTPEARKDMALEYCRIKKLTDNERRLAVELGSPEHMVQAEQCQAEMDKILDVFGTTHDSKAQSYAAGSCRKYPGDKPPG